MPGDKAPGLRFARTFNRAQAIEQVSFDRLSAVILWNVGCAGCLPMVDEIAELVSTHDIPVYGVAVMVRDVERTAAAATDSSPKAILALEERPAGESKLARGPVTRHWLEASGQQGVPAGYLVNRHGVVAWMGDPAEIRDVLPAVANGTWDVAAARERWRVAISDHAIAGLRVVRGATDALVAGQPAAAMALLEAGERAMPAIAENRDLNVLKLHALAASPASPASEQAAVAHYVRAADLSADDVRSQSTLASVLVRSFPKSRAALTAVRERLASMSEPPADNAPENILCKLLLAEVGVRLGATLDVTAAIERAAALAEAPDLPTPVRAWATTEIERVRGLISIP